MTYFNRPKQTILEAEGEAAKPKNQKVISFLPTNIVLLLTSDFTVSSKYYFGQI